MRNCQLLNNRFLDVSLDCLLSSVAPWTFVEVQSLIFDLLLLLLFIYLFIYFCACECLSEIVACENFVCDQESVSSWPLLFFFTNVGLYATLQVPS